jgi:prepilin-type N-terminal cleavage/methylation domain-containing protein
MAAFTLVELALVLVIIGVLSTLAVATLQELQWTRREAGGAQVLASALRRARAFAVDTHSRVRIDLLGGGVALSSCAARYGSAGCAAGETFVPVPAGVTDLGVIAEFRGLRVVAPTTTLVFDAAGFPEQAATYAWTIDHPRLGGDRQVIVNGGGEIRVR